MRKHKVTIASLAVAAGLVYVHADTRPAAFNLFEGHQDIGTPKPGTTFFDLVARSYSVTGGGASLGMKDAFQFAYTRLSGDLTFSADVRFSGPAPQIHSQAALMIRQSLETDSAYADAVLRGDGSTALQYRPGKGVQTSEFRAAMKSPSHLSIARHGHEFTIEAGNPGEEPAMTGPIVVSMQDPVYIGLAVCAQNTDALTTAVFSNVRITKGAVR